jgi:hypothetical protein
MPICAKVLDFFYIVKPLGRDQAWKLKKLHLDGLEMRPDDFGLNLGETPDYIRFFYHNRNIGTACGNRFLRNPLVSIRGDVGALDAIEEIKDQYLRVNTYKQQKVEYFR